MLLHKTLLAIPLLALAPLAGLVAHRARVAPVQAAQIDEQPLAAIFGCYQRAHDRTRLGQSSIAELCRGASDANPVDCFLAARDRTFLADDEAIALCRCASSTEPATCFVYGRENTTLARDRLFSVCAPVERFDLDASCMPPRR